MYGRNDINIQLIVLQYKIFYEFSMHLEKYNFVSDTSANCEYCNVEQNTVHTFYGCKVIKTFWLTLKSWMNQYINVSSEFKIEEIIFGICDNIPFNTITNFCILIGKFFIHICNLDNKKPSLLDYIVSLKHYLEIEKQVYDKKGKSGKFSVFFGQLYNRKI